MLKKLIINKCQKKIKKTISRQIWASGYCTWTKTNIQGTKGKFVQIIHSGNYQWAVISHITCSNSKIGY